MRTIWNGSISFGLVNIPVGLALATTPKAKQSDVSFRTLHRECKTPIRQKRWCPTHEREVGPDEIVKGWEVAKGEFVFVEDADLEAIMVQDDSRAIEITRFVPLDQVDPVFYDRTYYLAPASAAAQRRPYVLLLRAMQDAGSSTVLTDLHVTYGDCAVFLGAEPTMGPPPIRRFDSRFAKREVRNHLLDMGIDIRDPDQPVGTLSGGERQAVAIARAVYFGARVLILDEPTSALGVKQAGIVLRYVVESRDRGIGVIFITHNPHHAYPVGDRFVILNRGVSLGTFPKKELDQQELVRMMAGGHELTELQHELEGLSPDVNG